MEKLTHQEELVMLEIWKQKEGTIKNFLEAQPEPRAPYTTFASIVKNLERKGYVTSKKYGTTCVYYAAIKQDEYKRNFLSRIVSNYFGSSYKEMVSFFAKDEKITPEELAEILRMIEDKEE